MPFSYKISSSCPSSSGRLGISSLIPYTGDKDGKTPKNFKILKCHSSCSSEELDENWYGSSSLSVSAFKGLSLKYSSNISESDKCSDS